MNSEWHKLLESMTRFFNEATRYLRYLQAHAPKGEAVFRPGKIVPKNNRKENV
jgi:hypothetical protein